MGQLVYLILIVCLAGVLLYVNVLLLRWAFKIDHIVRRLDQLSLGMEKLNKTMSAAHPMPDEPAKVPPVQQEKPASARHPRYS